MIPRAAFFISDFPFVAFVRNRMLSQRQDPPDAALFRDCLSFGRLAEWQLAAYRDYQSGISDGLDHQQMWRANLIVRMFFVAIAFPSTDSLNWDGHNKTVNLKTDDSGSSIRRFSLVGAMAPSPEPHVPKPACVQPDL